MSIPQKKVPKFIPFKTRVLVEPAPVRDRTDGGIIIPDGAKEKPVVGTIISAGRKCEEAEAGQVVYYGQFAGAPIVLDGKTYLHMTDDDLILRINPEYNAQNNLPSKDISSQDQQSGTESKA